MLLQSYILDDQDIAQEFTYHHRLPSPSPGFESQDPPSLSPHAVGDGASVPHWNQWELGQDGRDRQNIWYSAAGPSRAGSFKSPTVMIWSLFGHLASTKVVSS